MSKALDIQKGIDAIVNSYCEKYHVALGSEQAHEVEVKTYLMALLLRMDELEEKFDTLNGFHSEKGKN